MESSAQTPKLTIVDGGDRRAAGPHHQCRAVRLPPHGRAVRQDDAEAESRVFALVAGAGRPGTHVYGPHGPDLRLAGARGGSVGACAMGIYCGLVAGLWGVVSAAGRLVDAGNGVGISIWTVEGVMSRPSWRVIVPADRK